MELARKPEFGYLKYPHFSDILMLPEAAVEKKQE